MEQLEGVEDRIGWRETERTVTYAIFSDGIVFYGLLDIEEERDDVHVVVPADLMER